MVSFSCEGCGDVLTKKKLDPHRNQCWGASYTCIDCMVHFQGTDYRSHTSCMSEAQKYQGKLYREKKPKGQQQQQKVNTSQALVPHNANSQPNGGEVAVVDVPPRAPTPPAPVNVFDFLVTDETPNASKFSLPPADDSKMIEDTNTNPITPAPKASKADKDTTGKKSDKKRKRQHLDDLDISAVKAQEEQDAMMLDAPPVLHSGLTGGLNKLLARPEYPPSPDYSGDAADGSAASPLKRTKQARTDKEKESSRKVSDSSQDGHKSRRDKDSEKEKRRSREIVRIRRRRSSSSHSRERERKPTKPLKAIEYHRSENGDSGALVLHKRPNSRAELFLSYVNKGPESERGLSLNKALKRYHRERYDRGLDDLSRYDDEKELWKSIRLRKNDRGEIVLFTE